MVYLLGRPVWQCFWDSAQGVGGSYAYVRRRVPKGANQALSYVRCLDGVRKTGGTEVESGVRSNFGVTVGECSRCDLGAQAHECEAGVSRGESGRRSEQGDKFWDCGYALVPKNLKPMVARPAVRTRSPRTV